MDIATLNKANDLNKKIKDLEYSLGSFEWEEGITRHPSLCIICDDGDDGREEIMIPIVLNIELVRILKKHIICNLELTRQEFNDLK